MMKPTDETVERVARAILQGHDWTHDGGDDPALPTGWESVRPDWQDAYRAMARAAIAAMPDLPAQGEPEAWRYISQDECGLSDDPAFIRAFMERSTRWTVTPLYARSSAALPSSPAISPADLAEVLENVRKAIENLSDFRSVKNVPIELHKACHALTHIVALLKP